MSDVDQAIILAEMQVDFDFRGRRICVPARFVQKLKNHPHIVVQISEFPWSYELFSHNSSGLGPGEPSIASVFSEGPSQIRLDNDTVVNVVPTSLIFGQREFELHLRQRPCVVLDLDDAMHEIQFDIMNFTGDVLNWPVAFSKECWELSFDPVENRSKLEEMLRNSAGFGITHKARLTRKDGRGFKVNEVQSFLDGVDAFMSFLCGSHCAITNVNGIEGNGNIVWQRWGPRHVSGWKRQRSFADITMSHKISEIFSGFMECYLGKPDHLSRIIALFVSSNEHDSVDISIMLTQIALEIFTAASADTPASKKQKLGDRFADVLKCQGIDHSIPGWFDELNSLGKQHGWQHGPHALVAIRNSFVHPDSKLETVSMDAYYQAQQLGLWYLELLLLHSFGYEGEYASRLEPVQMAGETELVPWAKEN